MRLCDAKFVHFKIKTNKQLFFYIYFALYFLSTLLISLPTWQAIKVFIKNRGWMRKGGGGVAKELNKKKKRKRKTTRGVIHF